MPPWIHTSIKLIKAFLSLLQAVSKALRPKHPENYMQVIFYAHRTFHSLKLQTQPFDLLSAPVAAPRLPSCPITP